jgi:hypothetical protein
MAKKKFLQEDGIQVWPITRSDCIYTVDGTKLLTEDYSSKDDLATEKNRAETAEKANSDAIEKIKEEMIHDFIDENDLDIIMADIENE